MGMRVESVGGEMVLHAISTLLLLGTAPARGNSSGGAGSADVGDGSGVRRAVKPDDEDDDDDGATAAHRAWFYSPIVHQRDIAGLAMGALLRAYAATASGTVVGGSSNATDGSGGADGHASGSEQGLVSGLFSVLSMPWQATAGLSAALFGEDDAQPRIEAEVSSRLRRDAAELFVLLLCEPDAVGDAGTIITNQVRR